jgi:RimJ/RimL family protein N-acetyltransferase
MILLESHERKSLFPLFETMHDTMILSCLQGHMGQAIVDRYPNPQCAKLIVADFCFIAGDSNCNTARELVAFLPLAFQGRELIYITQNDKWDKLIEQCYKEKCQPTTRYAFFKDTGEIDTKKLKEYIKALPTEYQIKRIDETLARKILSESWSYDLCGTFPTIADFLNRGIGFVIVKGDEVVAGASSYAIYDRGIEIEVDTKPEFRQNGLATVAASALILHCLEHGIYPNWDAANMASVRIATKLGYRLEKEYRCYYVR